MHMARKRVWIALLALSLLMLGQGEVSLAQTTSSEMGLSPATRHCVASLQAQPEQSRVKIGILTGFACYPTFAEAIFEATDGAVWLPEADLATQREILRSELELVDRVAVETKFVLAIDYSGSNFTGSTLVWEASGTCVDSAWFVNSMPSGWNDVVSSTQGYSGCNFNQLWEHNNRTGANQVCTPSCATLGAMDNQTSSRYWAS